jgi:hypothetical protein
MMKRYFSRGAQGKGDPGKRLEEDKGDDKEKDDDFPIVNNCFMIFGGPVAYDSRHQRKLEHREVYAAEPAMLAFLDWSGSAITFTVMTTRIVSHSQANTRLLSTPSSATRGSPRY